MRTNYFFFCLIINIFFISTTTFAQTINFDETWKEFLENNKISNMSQLVKPDKVYDLPDYAKYLLMNTNSSFCQSEMDEAENLMAEIHGIDTDVHESIPGFVRKMEDLENPIVCRTPNSFILEEKAAKSVFRPLIKAPIDINTAEIQAIQRTGA